MMEHESTPELGDKGVVLSSSSRRYQSLNSEQACFNHSKLNSRRERHRLQLDQIKLTKYLKGPDVLDFPIGTGRLLEFTAGRYNLYGFDISPTFVERAKELYPGIADHFEVHSMESAASPRQFNSIYSLRVTGHIRCIPLAIASVAKLVAPGGCWIFNIAPQHPDYPRLASLLEANGMVLAAREKYDVYSGSRAMPRLVQRAYARWIQVVERLPVPFYLYRLVDTLMLPFAHTVLIVAEKPSRLR
jgi:2-polyprenyl-3-methyl-5-hydroxy-6-metoxy-1,4-benzoquinol methylase